ncbi:hypothetical protein Tco_0271723 [Tanacetum coccineum]
MLYIRGKENGEMLRDSVENGPYKFKSEITIKDTDGVTDIRRAQRLEDLASDDKLRYDSDIKAINILLLGLPVNIYTLINHYQIAKEICDRVKELMEGTEMTKQERESMLYDEFDKFTSEPGESIHSYYLRFTKLINDINMNPMSMRPMQINTKFVNHLQPEWSRFVTAAKQARNLHSITFDQLYAFLKHNERDAKEVREMRQRFLEPLALLANTYNPPPSYNYNQTYYAPIVVQQPPTFQPDTGLAIPTFLPTDDPIASLNKAMIFLSLVNRNNQASGALVINAVGNTGVNQPRDKMLLAQAQEVGVVLDEEQYDFLANNCDDKAIANAIFMANLSPSGSLNDDTVAPRYDSNILFEVPHYDTYYDSDMLNSNIQELGYIENIVSNTESYDELKGNSDVISYTDYMLTIENDEDNYVPPHVKKNDMILFVIEQMKSQVEKCNKLKQDAKSVNESLTSELERYKDRVLRNLNKARDLLTKFDECIKRRTTLSAHEIGSWEQSDIKGVFKANVIPFSENLKETFKFFEKGFIAEVKEMKDIFEQMEDEVDQCSVEKKF